MYKDIAKKLCICYYLCSDAAVLYGTFQYFCLVCFDKRQLRGESPGKLYIIFIFQKEGKRK